MMLTALSGRAQPAARGRPAADHALSDLRPTRCWLQSRSQSGAGGSPGAIDAFLILLRLVLQGECIRSWRRLGNNPLLQTRAPVALRLITHGKHDRSASISLRRELNSSSTRMISQKMSRLRPSMERTVPPSR